MIETITTNLVGAHFRPPARALLSCLPAGHPLFLRPEPTNEYDENAVQVLLRTSTIPTEEFFRDELGTQLAGQGFDLDAVLVEQEWHLGYLPKAAKGNPKLQEWNVDVQKTIHYVCELTPHDENDNPIVPCSLSFDSAGKPVVLIPWPPLPTGPDGKRLPQAGELSSPLSD